jgi:hypothetical protein
MTSENGARDEKMASVQFSLLKSIGTAIWIPEVEALVARRWTLGLDVFVRVHQIYIAGIRLAFIGLALAARISRRVLAFSPLIQSEVMA